MDRIVRKEIEIIKTDMQQLLIHVDSFTRHNRNATERERLDQFRDLEKYFRLKQRLNVLEDCLNTYVLECEKL